MKTARTYTHTHSRAHTYTHAHTRRHKTCPLQPAAPINDRFELQTRARSQNVASTLPTLCLIIVTKTSGGRRVGQSFLSEKHVNRLTLTVSRAHRTAQQLWKREREKESVCVCEQSLELQKAEKSRNDNNKCKQLLAAFCKSLEVCAGCAWEQYDNMPIKARKAGWALGAAPLQPHKVALTVSS